MKTDNQAMPESGPQAATKRLAGLLKIDLAKGKVDRKALAKACDVSQQSISGWISTGRIAKANLAIVAQYTRRPLAEYMAAIDDEESATVGYGVSEPPPRHYLEREMITVGDIANIWTKLNPERQRRLLATAFDYLTAQRAEKPNDGNPYANVAAPLPPIPGKSPHINKANP